MDKEILKYLDKVGSYIQGASEQGFKTYVHGVFVESIVNVIMGVFLSVIAAIIFLSIKKNIEKSKKENISSIFYDRKYEDETVAGTIGLVIPCILIIIGFIVFATNITGVFAPDYAAIKNIISSIRGK